MKNEQLKTLIKYRLDQSKETIQESTDLMNEKTREIRDIDRVIEERLSQLVQWE